VPSDVTDDCCYSGTENCFCAHVYSKKRFSFENALLISVVKMRGAQPLLLFEPPAIV